jgi:hypothetical protein
MIIDFLTVFFLVAGLLLLLRLIRQRRRTRATIVIEENTVELERSAAELSGFRESGISSEELNSTSKPRWDLISQGSLQENPAGVWPDEGIPQKHPGQSNFDLSKLISILEGFASKNEQNGAGDHFTTDAATAKSQPKMTSSNTAGEHALNTAVKRPPVEAQTPGSISAYRDTIMSADQDLAKILRKIVPD